MTLDLAPLPKHRAARIAEAYERELAATRIPGLVDALGAGRTLDETYSRVVEALQAEGGYAWLTERWVRRVDREGR